MAFVVTAAQPTLPSATDILTGFRSEGGDVWVSAGLGVNRAKQPLVSPHRGTRIATGLAGTPPRMCAVC